MNKRTQILNALLISIAIAFSLPSAEAQAKDTSSPLIDAYEEGLAELSSALQNAHLAVDEENWVRRQHRILRIRSEIQLSRGMTTPADADLLRREMRSLVHAIEAMKKPTQTTQTTQNTQSR